MSQDHSPSRKNEMRFKQTRTRVLVAVTVLALIGFFIWTTDVELSAFHICGPPEVVAPVDYLVKKETIPNPGGLFDPYVVLDEKNIQGKDERDKNRIKCLLTLKEQLKQIVGPYVKGRHAILLDQVFHWNIGDSFIQYGEHLFLEDMGTPNKIPCSATPWFAPCNKTQIREAIKADNRTPILLVRGGGNYGDLYDIHRWFINDYVKSFHDVEMLLLPQTVYYESYQKAYDDSLLRAAHPKYDLLARDFVSLDRMRSYFPKQMSALSPDFAQYIGPVDSSHCKPSVDVLLLVRKRKKDKEVRSGMGDPVTEATALVKDDLTYKMMDWFDYKEIIQKHNWTIPKDPLLLPKFRTNVGIKMLCEGRLVITDRLHATIMSTLMGLPHIYLDNSYGKIRSYKSAIYQPIMACRNDNLKGFRAKSWNEAISIAQKYLKN